MTNFNAKCGICGRDFHLYIQQDQYKRFLDYQLHRDVEPVTEKVVWTVLCEGICPHCQLSK